jgi:cell division cycle 14
LLQGRKLIGHRNGDLNLLGPFIPFASPIEGYWVNSLKASTKTVVSPSGVQRTTTTTFAKGKTVTKGFKNVLRLFYKTQVGVVVRLNEEL